VFKRVLIGIDESGSRSAIRLGEMLCASDGELTLGHVFPGPAQVYGPLVAEYEAAVREEPRQLLQKARAQAGIRARLCAQEAPSVGRGLHDLCEQVCADLLVVGSSRRGAVERLLVGDDAQAATNGAPCAVAVAPHDWTGPTTLTAIGVGYNGSPESQRAIAVAREIADKTGARLSAFEAVSYPTKPFRVPPLPLADAIDAVVAEARERIEALGGIDAHAGWGEPADQLAGYSASVNLLVIGSRGYGPVGRLIHGSTSSRLAHSAQCPLLVLPRGAGTRTTGEPANGRRARGEKAHA
jgi:nucleotide-binding universal stress UspA family protein